MVGGVDLIMITCGVFMMLLVSAWFVVSEWRIGFTRKIGFAGEGGNTEMQC
jgi:hypothetical protein